MTVTAPPADASASAAAPVVAGQAAVAAPPGVATADAVGPTVTGGAGGAAIVQRGTAVTRNSGTAATTSVAFTVPAGVQDGDLWLVCIGQANNGAITVPDASWVLLAQRFNSTQNQTTAYVRRLLAADAGGTHTFTLATSSRNIGLSTVWAGVDTSDLAGGSHLAATPVTRLQTSSTSRTSSDITPASAPSLLYFAHTERTGTGVTDTTFTPDAATTAQGQATSTSTTGNNAAGAQYTQALSVIGATGTRTATANYSNGATVITAVLKAAAAGGGSAAVTTYLWGGARDASSFIVSACSAAGASVQVQASTSASFTTVAATSVLATADAQGWSKHTLSGLAADTVYYFRAVVGGITDTTVGTCRTLTTAAKSFKVGFASCHDNDHTESTVYSTILANGPDLFIHLGDFNYGDVTTSSQATFRNNYTRQLNASVGLSTMLRTIPVQYKWSDHDSGPNDWSPGPGVQTPACNAAYRQVVPHPTLETSDGAYYSFVHGRVRFIVTDDRSYKTSSAATDDASKSMWGATQKAWIKARLLDPEPVKVLCLDVPWVEAVTAGSDKWGGYSTERAEIASFCQANNVKLWIIHGDAHSVCADDGTNSVGGIPVSGAAPLSQLASQKGGPYSAGIYPSSGSPLSHQFGLLAVTDTGGSTITIAYAGKDSGDVTRVSMAKTFTLTSSTPATVAAPPALATADAGVPSVFGGSVSSWGRMAGRATTSLAASMTSREL